MAFTKNDLQKYYFDYKGRTIVGGRYINVNGFASAVVASLTFRGSGNLYDWTVYWGGCDKTRREHDCLEWVADHGARMSVEDAAHFFDDLPIGLYRE